MRLNAEMPRRFERRHRDLHRYSGSAISTRSPTTCPQRVDVSADRRRLIGAYFTHEYSVEAAALFNPSIVPAPDQSGLPSGAKRFVMSLRAVGEGHLSSIEFRSGVLGANGEIGIDDAGTYLVAGQRTPPAQFDKAPFAAKLQELGAINELSSGLLDRLGTTFTPEELEAALSIRESGAAPGDLVRDRARSFVSSPPPTT